MFAFNLLNDQNSPPFKFYLIFTTFFVLFYHCFSIFLILLHEFVFLLTRCRSHFAFLLHWSFSLITAGFFFGSLLPLPLFKAWKRSFHLFHSAFIFFYIENLLYPISKDELSDHLIYTKLKEPFCKPKTKF